MVVSHLVAISKNNVIGKDNDLPWRLKKDLEHFKLYTMNKPIIMGRKTYDSIGRPLPNRINIVISRNIKKIDGVHVFSDISKALDFAKDNLLEACNPEIVIIGGGNIYKQTMDICNKLVITRVNCEIDGDVFYPEINSKKWNKVSSNFYKADCQNEYDFCIEEYDYL